MDKAQKPLRTARHALVQYTLTAQPRPGDRQTRMREIGGAWLQRNKHDHRTEGTT